MRFPSLRASAGRFRFVTDCIGSTGEDIRDLVDSEQDISRRSFAIAVGPSGYQQVSEMLGYDRHFPLSRDWHVGYYRGRYRGVPAVFLRHSHIEYIFTLDGKVGPSAAPERREGGGCSLLARHHVRDYGRGRRSRSRRR